MMLICCVFSNAVPTRLICCRFVWWQFDWVLLAEHCCGCWSGWSFYLGHLQKVAVTHLDDFFANRLIRPSNLGLIMSLLNMLVSLVACLRKARASITDVKNSLLTSIFYLLNLPMTFSQVSVIAYAAETFNDWIFWRLMLVIRFAVRRFSFQISLFILGALRWGQFSGLSYFLFKIFNFSSSKPLQRT